MDAEMFLEPVTVMWAQTASVLPTILGAIVIFVVGMIAASVFSSIARRVVNTLKIDSFAERFSFFRNAQDSGWKIRPSHVIGTFVKWFFIIVTLIAVSDTLNAETISGLLENLVNFIPVLIVAVILLGAGFMVGQFVHDIVKQSMKTMELNEQTRKVVPLFAKYSIIVFASMAAASHVGIGQDLIQTFFTAVMFALALGLGLAFGLGGKEHATRALDKITNHK